VFCLYKIETSQGKKRYVFDKETHLFGCNKGLMVQILKADPPISQGEAVKWQINLIRDLPKIGIHDKTLVIDLKPNAKNNLSLYELVNIFGFSAHGWTPMLLHLKSIFVDDEGPEEMKKMIEISEFSQDDIFTFAHVMDGSIEMGRVVGKWVAPRPSSTNSALLWDSVFEYFYECKKSIDK